MSRQHHHNAIWPITLQTGTARRSWSPALTQQEASRLMRAMTREEK